MQSPTVGVLALQGAFAKHQAVLESLGVATKTVRRPQELEGCEGLVIPGGESTTMLKQIAFIGFRDALCDFAATKPVFGTCAGLILLAKEVVGGTMDTLGLMNITVERNGFGPQYESFSAEISLQAGKFNGVFIRAPRLQRAGAGVKVLAQYNGEPVWVQQGHLLGTSFHPELTKDLTIHRYFVQLLRG